MSNKDKAIGSKLGLALRDSSASAVGSTERIRHLNRLLHSQRPSLDIHRTRVFTEHFKATEGQSFLKRRYGALAKVFASMPVVIYDDERLLGWQGSKIRSCSVCIEAQAHWLATDLATLNTRDYDPWQFTEEERDELYEVHLPYWKNKTLYFQWKNQVSNEGLVTSGYTDVSNFVNNPGAHFQADMELMLQRGIRGNYELCERLAKEIDYSVPENVGKKEFYEGMMAVCLGIREYGENYYQEALKQSESEINQKRKKELFEAGERIRKICWEKPETFVECLHLMWLMTIFVMTECPAPASCGLGRVDQYLWPYLEKDLEAGRITVDEAFEYLQEFDIKCTNMVWLMPENNTILFGGYYRWAGSFAVGGVDERGQDAVNPLSYMFLRASRVSRTTAPPVHVNLSAKNPDSFLYEAIKLCAAGTGQPAFFNVDAMHDILLYKSAGKNQANPLSLSELRKQGCTYGCQEPGLQGYIYGHADSCIVNLGNCISLALNNGVLSKECPGWGAGQKIGVETGDPCEFQSFEEFYQAVLRQFEYAVDVSQEHMLVCEKLETEQFQMPVQTMLGTGCLEKGKDIASGSAKLNQGPCYAIIGVADFADSLAVVKKLVFEDKSVSMKDLITAVNNDFVGYEKLRSLCLSVPKWGNDNEYVDSILADSVLELSDYVRSKRNYRGSYCDLSVQNNQVQVPAGAQCCALPNGRKAFLPFADTMAAEQQMDVHGPLAAINSYSKIDHTAFTNGTICNMWISKGDLVEE